MGRLQEMYSTDHEFVNAMHNEISLLVNGQPMKAAQSRARAVYERQMAELRRYADTNGQDFEQDKHDVSHVFGTSLINSAGAPIDASGRPVNEDGASKMDWSYDFIEEPAFDYDDVVAFSNNAAANPAYVAVVQRWLSRRAFDGDERARAALVDAFRPLAIRVADRYTARPEDRNGNRQLAENQLVLLVSEFHFFYKKYALIGDKRFPTDELVDRESGTVTSTFEISLATYLKKRLPVRARAEIFGADQQPRTPGPFSLVVQSPRSSAPQRDSGDGTDPQGLRSWSREVGDTSYYLMEDATFQIGLSESQIRRRIKQGLLPAEKTADLRKRFDDESCEGPLVLENFAGMTVSLEGGRFWVFRAEDVHRFQEDHRRKGGLLKRQGRPRKGANR